MNREDQEQYERMIEGTLKLIEKNVSSFSFEVKETLRRNAFLKGKGSWIGVPKEVLISKLYEEVNELVEALEEGNPEHITLESTDVSAVAMMLRDNFGDKK